MTTTFGDIFRNRWLLGGAVLISFFLLGCVWAWGVQPQSAVAPISGRSIAEEPRPGAGNSEITARLRALVAPATIETVTDDQNDPANDDNPSGPDVEAAIRADITAVIHRDGDNGEAVWIIDRAEARLGARKRLVVGDLYLADWKLTNIGEQEVTLATNDETRTIQLYALPDE